MVFLRARRWCAGTQFPLRNVRLPLPNERVSGQSECHSNQEGQPPWHTCPPRCRRLVTLHRKTAVVEKAARACIFFGGVLVIGSPETANLIICPLVGRLGCA